MDRRDFFGVIAAPLLRRALPPTPVALWKKDASANAAFARFAIPSSPSAYAKVVDVKSIAYPAISRSSWDSRIVSLTACGSLTFDITFE